MNKIGKGVPYGWWKPFNAHRFILSIIRLLFRLFDILQLDPGNVNLYKDWKFAKGNFELMYHLIDEASWEAVLHATVVVSVVEAFYDELYGIFNE